MLCAYILCIYTCQHSSQQQVFTCRLRRPMLFDNDVRGGFEIYNSHDGLSLRLIKIRSKIGLVQWIRQRRRPYYKRTMYIIFFKRQTRRRRDLLRRRRTRGRKDRKELTSRVITTLRRRRRSAAQNTVAPACARRYRRDGEI